MIMNRYLDTEPIWASKLQVGRNYNKTIDPEIMFP